MNSRALLVFAVYALAVMQTPGHVKADGLQTKEAELKWGEAVNGLRGRLAISPEGGTRSYHPGEPFQFIASIKGVSGKSVRMTATANEMRLHTSLHVRIPNGRVFPSASRARVLLSQIPPDGSEFICLFDGRLNASIKGWLGAQTLEPDDAASFHQPGTYTFWFEYEVPSARPSAWSGKLESNHITLIVSDLPPAQRLQVPTAAQLDELRIFLGPSKGEYPHPGTIELVNAMIHTENEGLALYLMGQLDKNRAKRGQIFYLLAQRAAGIDGPYLRKLADWCVGILEHGNPPQSPLPGFDASVTDPPLEYLHFHPEDVKLRQRIVAVAELSANIPRFFPKGPDGVYLPRAPGGPLFLGFYDSMKILFDQKALHDGMSVEEVTAILGRPSSQGPTEITWTYANGAERQPRISADVKDGKLSHFR